MYHHVHVSTDTSVVTRAECKISQLKAMADTPDNKIVHGWHLETNGVKDMKATI